MNRIPLLNDPLNGHKPLEIGTVVYVRNTCGLFTKALVVQIFRPTKQTPKKKKFFTYKVFSVEDGETIQLRYHRRARGKKSHLHCFLEDEFRKAYPQSPLLPAPVAVPTVPVPVPANPNPSLPFGVGLREDGLRTDGNLTVVYFVGRVRKTFKYKAKTGDKCPFCPFKSGTMKRTLLEHLCGPRSKCRHLAQSPTARVINTNSFTKTGDTSRDMLVSLGFSNPSNYVDEYIQAYGAHCPHCDYKSIAKRKVTRHINQVHRTEWLPEGPSIPDNAVSIENK